MEQEVTPCAGGNCSLHVEPNPPVGGTGTTPQLPPLGIAPHTFALVAPHTSVVPQVPHSIVPPQPSGTAPQFLPSSAHVFRVHMVHGLPQISIPPQPSEMSP